MPLTVERNETQWVLRFDGELNMASAAELKQALVDGSSSTTELYLDCEGAQEVDVAILQLVWAAAREAKRGGARLAGRFSDEIMRLSRDAGFVEWPSAASPGPVPGAPR